MDGTFAEFLKECLELIPGALFWLLVITGPRIYGYFIRRNHKRLKVWRQAALSNGLHQLEQIAGESIPEMKLEARSGRLALRFEDARHDETVSTRVALSLPGSPGFANVSIWQERHKPYNARATEIVIGDGPFDSTFYIVGPPRLVYAFLTAETRRALLTSIHSAAKWEIVASELRATMLDQNITSVLPLVLDTGRQIAQPMDIVHRLAENAREDPVDEVRLQNLLVLVREFPEDPRAAEALRLAAASDSSGRVRLRAAREMGAEGRGIVIEIAESTEDDAVSAQAVSIVGRELPPERTRTILLQALRQRLLETARACLDVLGASGDVAVDTLAEVMEQESELSVAAAHALGATGSLSAEPPLVLALERETADLRLAAANALGRIGSAAAVLPLKEAARRFSRDSPLQRAARQAVAAIQSRVPDASPGQLALAETEAGQLSLAEAEAGQLSLATAPFGQLSLPSDGPGQPSRVGDRKT